MNVSLVGEIDVDNQNREHASKSSRASKSCIQKFAGNRRQTDRVGAIVGGTPEAAPDVAEAAELLREARSVEPFRRLPSLCWDLPFLVALAGRLAQNVIAFGESDDGLVYGVFVLLSLLNHSCDPNVDVLPKEDGCSVVLRVVRSVVRGEALTINYLAHLDPAPRTVRRTLLARHWGFECCCLLCEAQAEVSDAQPGLALERPHIEDSDPEGSIARSGATEVSEREATPISIPLEAASGRVDCGIELVGTHRKDLQTARSRSRSRSLGR